VLQKVAGKKIQIKIKEIKRPEANAQLIAENIARQLNRVARSEKAMKSAISGYQSRGARGKGSTVR
jgi:small subunit ribosomal protein S3